MTNPGKKAAAKKAPAELPPDTGYSSQKLFVDGVIGCFSFDFDGKILWSNSRVSELLDYPQSHLSGLTLIDLCCERPHGKTKAREMLQKFQAGEAIHDEQLQMCKSDGTPVWVSLNINATIDADGRVFQGSSTITDISEHKRTEEVLKRNFDAQKAIDSILQLSLGELGVKEILDNTLSMLFTIPWLAVESKGSIFLMDEAGDLVMVSSYGMSDAIIQACAHISLGTCLCGRAAQSGEVVYAAQIDERHDILYDDITPHGHYCLPMISRGKVIGILNCYLEAGHESDETEVRFLSSVAGVLAGVIERRRVEEELKRSESYTRSLLRIGRHMELARDHVDILKAASLEVKKIMGFNSTWLALSDSARKEVDIITIAGGLEEIEKSLKGDVKLHKAVNHFPVEGDRLLEEIIWDEKPAVIEEAIDDPRFNRKVVETLKNRTMISIPVVLMDGSVAVVNTGSFGDEGAHLPSDEQLEYFKSMASSISVVLDRFRFLEESESARAALQKSERYTRSLLDLAQAMEKARTLPDIVKAAHVEILKLVGYRSAWLCLVKEPKEEAQVLIVTGDMPEANYQLATIPVAGDRMMEEIVEGTHPVVVEDARTDPRANKKMVEATGNRTIVNIPKILMDGSLGVLGTGTFLDEGVKPPTDQELDYLDSMASSISVVLDRFRFLEDNERAQQDLMREKNFTDTAIKNIPGIFFLNHREKGIVKWNVNLETMTGFTAEEIAGMSLLDFFADEDRKKVSGYLEDIYAKGFARGEATILNRDGLMVPLYVSGSLVELDGEKYAIGSCIDISQRIKAETALQKSEEKYRSLFEESQDVVFISDLEGRFLDVNPAGVRLFGFDSEEGMLKSDMGLALYADAGDRETIRRMIVEQGFISNYELPLKTVKGKELVVFVTANAVRNDIGDVIAYRGIIRDMTSYRKLEEQLVQSQKMESIGRLAGGVSHDLNNYLTAIQGYADLALMEVPEDTEAAEDMREVRKSSDRAVALTKQLLLFSRRESMEIRPVELNVVVSDLLKMLGQLVGEQFRLNAALAADLMMINADAGYVEQVIMNLVVNARDAMPGGGEITIGTGNAVVDEAYTKLHPDARPGEFVCLTVRDTGIGMDERLISHIFEPFYSTKKTGKGTGLGLSVVHGIISQHGGWIDVDSTPGEGSVFRIYLPAAVPGEVEKGSDENTALPAETPGIGEKILLVEDDHVVRSLTQKLLEKCGYQVCPAPDAEQALDIFEELNGDFRMVLSDVVLPHMDGIQMADRLRGLKPGLQVLLMSGYSDESRRQQIRDKGYAFIHKPYTVPDLRQTVKRVLADEAGRRPV
ncbi:MAG: PAS domain S-box protein [Actinobacteria bacterium]|nr:PAS domain S-box protein [Actinomycetota bacterium]